MGICIWITVGYAVVIWARSRLSAVRETRVPKNAVQVSVLVLLMIATIAATVVVTYPYGAEGQRLDFTAMQRVQSEAKIVETHVPKGEVGIDVRYSGQDFLQTVQDERGAAYLLLQLAGSLGCPWKPTVCFISRSIPTSLSSSSTSTRWS